MRNLLIILLTALAGLVSTFPVIEPAKSVGPRACIFKPWDALFVLDETHADAYLPINDYLFQVYQKAGVSGGRATGRQYLLVHYPPTPYGTTACQLHWAIPANTQFLNYTGSHQLDVKQATAAYLPPFRPTWNNIVPKLEGTFGTVNAVTDVNSIVNTAICSNGPPAGAVGGGYGLAFVFKFADWVEQTGNAAAVSFYGGFTGPAGVFKGPYVEYNC